jgi:hypothetical protein
MEQPHKLSAGDVRKNDFLFRHFDDRIGKLCVRPRYADLVCRRCGKLDEIQALARGIEEDLEFPESRDFFHSQDHILIVRNDVRVLLLGLASFEVEYFPIPEYPELYAITPRTLVAPDQDSDAFRTIGSSCPACRRATEVVWGPGVPSIPEGPRILAFHLESRLGISPAWFVAGELAAALKSHEPKFSGLILRRL